MFSSRIFSQPKLELIVDDPVDAVNNIYVAFFKILFQ